MSLDYLECGYQFKEIVLRGSLRENSKEHDLILAEFYPNHSKKGIKGIISMINVMVQKAFYLDEE